MNIVIFNEYIHEKKDDIVKSVYPEGIHAVLAEILKGHTVRCITLDNIDELSQTLLAETDVLLWWGHVGHHLVPDELAAAVQQEVLRGMGLIALHSAHHSKPFKLLMGTPCNLSWRENGDWERVWVCNPAHPIANGLDRYFELGHEEVYAEPFYEFPSRTSWCLWAPMKGERLFDLGAVTAGAMEKYFTFSPVMKPIPPFMNPRFKRLYATQSSGRGRRIGPSFPARMSRA